MIKSFIIKNIELMKWHPNRIAGGLSSSWNMYRGLTPHKIMPMPSTHKAKRNLRAGVCGVHHGKIEAK
jgi:hypothetical protein